MPICAQEGGGAEHKIRSIPALRDHKGKASEPVTRNFQPRVVSSVIGDEKGTVGTQERHSSQPGRSRRASQGK